MQSFLLLIFQFIVFWFIEAPKAMIAYFISFNNATIKFLSLFILIKTFFKPWKNEYREGLVGFSIIMGMIIKSMIIFFDIVVLLVLFIFELVAIFLFACWPVITVSLPFL